MTYYVVDKEGHLTQVSLREYQRLTAAMKNAAPKYHALVWEEIAMEESDEHRKAN